MCPNPPSSSSSSSSSTSEKNFFPTFPKVFQSGPKACRKVQHGLKHLKCWFGPLWDTFGPFWALLEGCFQGTDAEDKQGVPQKRRVLEKNFQHKSCSLAHLEGYRSRGLACESKGIFKQIQRAIRARASLREPEGAKESQRECAGVSGGCPGCLESHEMVNIEKKSFINWLQSIVVNSILNLRFSG